MEILTLIAKFGCLLFGLLILFPFVVGPIMYAVMAASGAATATEKGEAHPQGTEWRRDAVPAKP